MQNYAKLYTIHKTAGTDVHCLLKISHAHIKSFWYLFFPDNNAWKFDYP